MVTFFLQGSCTLLDYSNPHSPRLLTSEDSDGQSAMEMVILYCVSLWRQESCPCDVCSTHTTPTHTLHRDIHKHAYTTHHVQ